MKIKKFHLLFESQQEFVNIFSSYDYPKDNKDNSPVMEVEKVEDRKIVKIGKN